MNEVGFVLTMLVMLSVLVALGEAMRQANLRQPKTPPTKRFEPIEIKVPRTPYRRRDTFSRKDFVPYQYREARTPTPPLQEAA